MRQRNNESDRALNLVFRSPSATQSFGRLIGQALHGGEVIGLYGELGAGKTTLVRGIADGLGADPRSVSSPTFVLIHTYHGRLPLAHVDLYRIRSEAELAAIGLSEHMGDNQTVAAIEWANKSCDELPADRLEVMLSHRSARTRAAQLVSRGRRSATLLSRIMRLYSRTRSQ